MGQYNFLSPGAEASDALTQQLMQQEALKRQAMIDDLNRRNTESQMADRETNRAIQADTMASNAAAREAAIVVGKSTTARNIAETTPRGTQTTPELEATLTEGGLGHLVQPGEKKFGVMAESEGQGPTMEQAPNTFGGTVKQDQFDEMQGLKESIAKATADAREQAMELQKAVMEGRISDAQARLAMTQANHELRERVQALAERKDDTKMSAADEEKAGKRRGMVNMTNDALAALEEVAPRGASLDGGKTPGKRALTPGMQSLVGAGIPGLKYIQGSQTATARAKNDALKAKLVIDLIGEMKSQSRTGATGFGALSAPELKILEDAAARLTTAQDEASFLSALADVEAKLQRILMDQAPATAAAPPQTPGAPSGAPAQRRRFNPATNKIEGF